MTRINQQTNVLSTKNVSRIGFWNVHTSIHCTCNHIQTKTARLQEIDKTTGSEINVDKTKSLRINPGNTQAIDIG